MNSFYLEDGTGRCLVDPSGAEVICDDKTVWYGSTPWPDIRLPAATRMLGRAFDMLTRGNYRYTEHRMRVGAPQDGRVFVLASNDSAALASRLRWRALGGVTGFLLALTAMTLLFSHT